MEGLFPLNPCVMAFPTCWGLAQGLLLSELIPSQAGPIPLELPSFLLWLAFLELDPSPEMK